MCGEGGLSRSEQLVGYFYSALPLDVVYWSTVWLSRDWYYILRQPAATRVYLLRRMPAWQVVLTLLDQGARNGHSL